MGEYRAKQARDEKGWTQTDLANSREISKR